jgi:hypothetical protein
VGGEFGLVLSAASGGIVPRQLQTLLAMVLSMIATLPDRASDPS